MQPCYTFRIESAPEDHLNFVAEEESELQVSIWLSRAGSWWEDWVLRFLSATASFFSKAYTAQQLQRITHHTLQGTLPERFPAEGTATPQSLQIRGGQCWVSWTYVAHPMTIDIPEEKEDILEALPDSLQEQQPDDLPVDPNATELILLSPTQSYDKQRVKEARLKAKLAIYRAEQQMNRYVEKYGMEVSDSDADSETEELSDEEIQLWVATFHKIMPSVFYRT